MRAPILGLCCLLSATASAQTTELPLSTPLYVSADAPELVQSVLSSDKVPVEVGKNRLKGYQLGRFLTDSDGKVIPNRDPVEVSAIAPIPDASNIGNVMKIYLALDSAFVPVDEQRYRIGVRYHSEFWPQPVPSKSVSTPPLAGVVDGSGGLWTVDADHRILRNGTWLGGAIGTKITIVNQLNVYVLGTDQQWWFYTGLPASQAWQPVGAIIPDSVSQPPTSLTVSMWEHSRNLLSAGNGKYTLVEGVPVVVPYLGPPPGPVRGRVIPK